MSKKYYIGRILFSVIVFVTFSFNNQTVAQSFCIYAGYPYYFMQLQEYGDNIDVSNNVNFIVGFSMSKHIRQNEIEVGLEYTSKNYSFTFNDILSEIKNEDINLKYYSIPIIYNINVVRDSINKLNIIIGNVFLKPWSYSKEIFLKDGSMVNHENDVKAKLGSTIRVGVKYSKKISKMTTLSLKLYSNYKYLMDYNLSGRSLEFDDLTDDRFDTGITLGIEHNLNIKR